MTSVLGHEMTPRSDTPLTVTDFVRYQGASGDMNPIHHDPVFAQHAGYPGVFAVGMLAAGRLGTFVTDAWGPRSVRRFGVRFTEQAWPGDVLSYSGRVSAVRDDNGERVADLELACIRQTGGIHLSGWATVAIE